MQQPSVQRCCLDRPEHSQSAASTTGRRRPARAARAFWRCSIANPAATSSSAATAARLQQNVWSLVPDDPNIEKAPDHSANDRNYDNYAVYWPARAADGSLRQPQRNNWTQDGVHAPLAHGGVRSPHRRDSNRHADRRCDGLDLPRCLTCIRCRCPPARWCRAPATNRPAFCPHCEANWSGMTNAAPIRTQRTGFQKIAQVLSDSLLREIAPPESVAGVPVEDPRRKLVLFSDSRQDAAKLAVGVAKSHWLDALRQALVDAMREQHDRGPRLRAASAECRLLSPTRPHLANRFAQITRPAQAHAILASRQQSPMARLPVGGRRADDAAARRPGDTSRTAPDFPRSTDLERESAGGC